MIIGDKLLAFWKLRSRTAKLAVGLAVLIAPAPVSACPESSSRVDVVAIHGPIHTRTDLDRDQLEDLRRRSGRSLNHEMLGFYGRNFGYTIKVETTKDPNGLCINAVHIIVRMALFDRDIELARDLNERPCLAAALAHYQSHAQADDAVFSEYVRKVREALHRGPLLPPGFNSVPEATGQKNIEDAVQSIVDQGLSSYNSAYAAAQNAVDTAEEASRLKSACSGEHGNRVPL